MDKIEQVLEQWEPKVHRMLKKYNLVGIPYEDQAQELRICIINAFNHFDKDRGVSFHTYLHTCMNNRLLELMAIAQKKAKDMSLDGISTNMEEGESYISSEITQALVEVSSHKEEQEYSYLELKAYLTQTSLTELERFLLDLLLQGYKFNSIIAKGFIEKRQARKAHKSLQGKFDWLRV